MTDKQKIYFRVAKAIFEKDAFARLRSLTFLGILSPKFRDIRHFPISRSKIPSIALDESRAHHSVAVARIASDAAHYLNLSEKAYKYAVAWGLLHDIATWPLSHTGEASFAESTGVDAHQLRSMMIYGSNKIGRNLHLHSAIRDAGLDHETLVAMFDKSQNIFADDLRYLHQIIHSVITPDTLEGMERSGKTYGLKTDNYTYLYKKIKKDMFSTMIVDEHALEDIKNFWILKHNVYKNFINADRTIEFESAWSTAIMDQFAKMPLRDTLELTEEEIIYKISSMPIKYAGKVQRYKPPLEYGVSSRYSKLASKAAAVPLESLSSVFVRKTHLRSGV